MNEKIKTLALKLGSLGDHMWLDGSDPEEEQAVEKFVELILNDISDVISDVYREMPLEHCGWMLHLDEKIKERFYSEQSNN